MVYNVILHALNYANEIWSEMNYALVISSDVDLVFNVVQITNCSRLESKCDVNDSKIGINVATIWNIDLNQNLH